MTLKPTLDEKSSFLMQAAMFSFQIRTTWKNGNIGTTTPLENTGTSAFATFGRHKSRTTGDLVITLASDDLTELQVPPTVTIPEGQQEITISIPVVDDNERDGDQSVTLFATSMEHEPGNLTVVVQDYEAISVNILPDAVSEAAGAIPGAIVISRSDVDGPLDFADSIGLSLEGPVPIIDDNIIISQVEVPSQVSRITDIDVFLSIDHEAIPDLDVYLISPSGTRVELFTDLSTNERKLDGTIFDDEAATAIIDGNSPYNRSIPTRASTIRI